MDNKSFSLTVTFDQTPDKVFQAITDVRGWWSQEIEGDTAQLNDEFTYRYQDVHSCRMKLIEVMPGQKMVWQVLDNHFSFTQDKTEWIGTKVIFGLSEQDGRTILHFTHEGLVPAYECYNACVNGWTQYIQKSLPALVATGKGQPNSRETAYTVHEVAARFHTLAQQEKWFEIQEELFAEDVRSIDPPGSPYLGYAEGKAAVRKKGEDFVSTITALHHAYTSAPLVSGHYFAVGREMEITVQGHGRIRIDQVMLYEVKEGKIVSEQFFY